MRAIKNIRRDCYERLTSLAELAHRVADKKTLKQGAEPRTAMNVSKPVIRGR
jgi:hypothetical protein